MKKIIAVLVFIIFALSSGMAQQTVISYKQWGTGDEQIKYECDSFYFHKSKLYTYKSGNLHVFRFAASVETPATEENIKRLEQFCEYQKKRCKNTAVGFCSAGLVTIFVGYIAADAYKKNADRYKHEAKTIENNTKTIQYASIGLGAAFEIIGIVKVVQFANGSSFRYDVKNDGVTVTYRFR